MNELVEIIIKLIKSVLSVELVYNKKYKIKTDNFDFSFEKKINNELSLVTIRAGNEKLLTQIFNSLPILLLLVKSGKIRLSELKINLEENHNEIWKPINGYENMYYISNLGRIKSMENNASRKEKILKQIGNRKKYVNLSKNGKSKSYPVDELLASTFNYAK